MKFIDRYWLGFAFRHMALMTARGVPLHEAFSSEASDVSSRCLAGGLRSCAEMSAAGMPLDQIPAFRSLAPRSLVGLFGMAATTATMTDAFHHCGDALTNELDQSLLARWKWISPGFIFAGTLLFIFILGVPIASAVCSFSHVFVHFPTRLPPATRLTFAVSFWMGRYWWLLFTLTLFAGLFVNVLQISREKLAVAARFCWKIGALFGDSRLRFSDTLMAYLILGLKLKLPLTRVIGSLSESTGDLVWKTKCDQLIETLSEGESLPAAIERLRLPVKDLPDLVANLRADDFSLTILEETRKNLNEEVNRKIHRNNRRLAVAYFIMLVLVVGFTVVSIYLPISHLISHLSR